MPVRDRKARVQIPILAAVHGEPEAARSGHIDDARGYLTKLERLVEGTIVLRTGTLRSLLSMRRFALWPLSPKAERPPSPRGHGLPKTVKAGLASGLRASCGRAAPPLT